MRELVTADSQLLPAISLGCAQWEADGSLSVCASAGSSAGQLVRAAHLRRTAARVDPSVRPADRAAAVDAGRGRPRARRSGRGPHGELLRRVREPQHGAAAGRSVARPRSSGPAGGRRRYATSKGRHYGTVLVDIESRRPVDLLPDREASSLAAWLAKRPTVEVVCRDRAPLFAEGATTGAPQAVQGGRQVASLAQP
ncbi:transposase [Streptomyces microflavus]|uniref:transposase n=1 Tax=Streptomyces microflavus TaxID=1919 RepID=UPI00366466DD